MTHTTTTRALRSGLLTAAALLAACATPASATAGGAHAGTWLHLTVTRGETPSAVTRGALLRCDPPQGHPRAARACAELGTANGDIAGLRPQDAHCPMVYAPVTAHARGQWRGRPVEYTATFPNGCVMAARTGSVFALDGAGPGPSHPA
ncbi:SSI family serine proteinase inhibitor [Streptomyces glaucus]|uniref:Subtilisin inhibitor domain-containing protein n=1 Tax=Streptomyces glaucus TaxID=284029 RepID=A0ABN3JB41_9ACTN